MSAADAPDWCLRSICTSRLCAGSEPRAFPAAGMP
ncbi:hypothetical protein [Propionibacterium phage Philemon]|uniref:Minor tail protein n=1 Tax=Propionibacterium phage Philemon TaxID=3141823 RepID=A0AAU6VX97_9VIRU